MEEAESIINIYIASNLNDNTFHLSPNETNFLCEQIEHKLKNSETVNHFSLDFFMQTIGFVNFRINKIDQSYQ